MGDVWKVRRRQEVFGFSSEGWVGLAERGMLTEGDGVVLRRRQRVYGCEDYPWGDISRAMNRVVGTNGGRAGGTGSTTVGGSESGTPASGSGASESGSSDSSPLGG